MKMVPILEKCGMKHRRIQNAVIAALGSRNQDSLLRLRRCPPRRRILSTGKYQLLVLKSPSMLCLPLVLKYVTFVYSLLSVYEHKHSTPRAVSQ